MRNRRYDAGNSGLGCLPVFALVAAFFFAALLFILADATGSIPTKEGMSTMRCASMVILPVVVIIRLVLSI